MKITNKHIVSVQILRWTECSSPKKNCWQHKHAWESVLNFLMCQSYTHTLHGKHNISHNNKAQLLILYIFFLTLLSAVISLLFFLHICCFILFFALRLPIGGANMVPSYISKAIELHGTDLYEIWLYDDTIRIGLPLIYLLSYSTTFNNNFDDLLKKWTGLNVKAFCVKALDSLHG